MDPQAVGFGCGGGSSSCGVRGGPWQSSKRHGPDPTPAPPQGSTRVYTLPPRWMRLASPEPESGSPLTPTGSASRQCTRRKSRLLRAPIRSRAALVATAPRRPHELGADRQLARLRCRASDHRYSSITRFSSVIFSRSSSAGSPLGCGRAQNALTVQQLNACNMFEPLSRLHRTRPSAAASRTAAGTRSPRRRRAALRAEPAGGAAHALRHGRRLHQRVEQRLGGDAPRHRPREVLLVVLVARVRHARPLVRRRPHDRPHQVPQVELVLHEVGRGRRATRG